MADYEKMYHSASRALADVSELLWQAVAAVQNALQECEDTLRETADEELP